MIRPSLFKIDPAHYLSKGLIFAGLGGYGYNDFYYDYSLYSYHSTLKYMVPTDDWFFDTELKRGALNFDGDNDRVYMPKLTRLGGSLECTICCWFKKYSYTQYQSLLSSWYTFSGNQFIFGYENPNGTISVYFSDGSHSSNAVISGVQSDTWHFAAGILNNGDITIYLDGSSNTTSGTSVSYISNSPPDEQDYRVIGSYSNGYFWHGDISDVLIYNRALSTAELDKLSRKSNNLLSGLIKPVYTRAFSPSVDYYFRDEYIVFKALNQYLALKKNIKVSR